MALLLVYDTETTKLPLWSQPSEHPDQPHLVELAAVLADTEKRQDIKVFNSIVCPDGWIIPDDVSKIHGITTERALAEGEPEIEVTEAFLALAAKADVIASYGIDFDLRIMRIAMLRAGMAKTQIDEWKASHKFYCVQRACTPVCKLPATPKMIAAGRRNQAKTPNLGEAARIILGETLDGAHAAMVDVRATLRIAYALKDRITAAVPEPAP